MLAYVLDLGEALEATAVGIERGHGDELPPLLREWAASVRQSVRQAASGGEAT